MEFGDRLRRLRASQNLTVRELARRVGVSASYISQLENKECMPSFSSLKRIAEILGVPVSVLTEDVLPEEWVVVRKHNLKRVILGGDDGWDVRWLGFTGTRDKRMQPCLVRMEPGTQGLNPIFHHDREDFIYILEGRIVVRSKEQEYDLSQGDAAYFNFHRPESLINPGDTDAVFLWVVSPAR